MMLGGRIVATLLIVTCQSRLTSSAVLSVNKAIRMSNQFYHWQPGKAVDGNHDNYADTCNCCASTVFQFNPWYELDLGKSHIIHRITVEGRAETHYLQHFQDMHIYFKRVDDGFHNEETSISSATSIVNYTLSAWESTRYVSFVLLDVWRQFTICELTVYGDCADGEFGNFCEYNCYCEGQPCHKISGICPTGICKPGYKGQTCSTACQFGTYGSGCTENCGKCVGFCDRTNGNCPGKCLPGFQGVKCNRECDGGKYGQDCLNDCGRCRNGERCNATNGVCIECADGYQMDLCIKECNPGYYGKNCAATCGQCKMCTICIFTNGTCPSGCRAGYEGHDCKTECTDGFFGEKCLYRCGNCLEGAACHKVTGICENGCSIGFKNDNCDETCSYGFYGDRCLNACGNCKSGGTCNHINGACESGCPPGFKAPFCNDECENGTYGEGCFELCGFCFNGKPCDKSNGTCTSCVEGYSGTYCRSSLTESPTSGVSAGAVGGAVAGVLIIISVAVGVFWFLRKRRANRLPCSYIGPKDHTDTKTQNEAISSEKFTSLYSTPNKSNSMSTITLINKKKKDIPTLSASCSKELQKKDKHAEKSEYYYFLIKRTDLKICQLWDYIYQKKKEDNLLFYQEFNRLPSGLRHKYDVACLQKNKSKNRYKALCAYDHSRVPLEADNGESDYINASFIDGEEKPRKFIASQGPTEQMKDDFMNMLWEQHIKQIVMLTDLIERETMKCLRYWPTDVDGEVTIGKVTVKLVSESKLTGYVIRNLKVRQNLLSWRDVTHYHFLSWPDKEVPDSTWPLVKLWRLVMNDTPDDAGPILVHCSAGIGRTGTFIAMDNAYDKAKSSGVIKILDTVTQLREQRVNMVQTRDQYVFLHEAVADSLLFGTHFMWTKDLPEIYDYMMQNDPDSSSPRLQIQYKLIEESVEDRQRVIGRNRTPAEAVYSNIYIHGNKSETVISIDEFMPESRSQAHAIELGALLLPNYEEKDVFIVSKSPTKATLEGFWSLIAKHNIKILVTVPETSDANRKTEKMSRDLGASDGSIQNSFGVRLTEGITNDIYSQKRFTYDTEEGITEITQFEFTCWDDNQPIPDSTRSMVDFLVVVLDQQQRLTATQPVLIHCRNGFDRSGILCVLLNELDRMRRDQGRINIVETVKLMKARRVQIIPNFEQYKYLYDVIMESFRKGDVYANC